MAIKIYRVSVDPAGWRLFPVYPSFWERENLFRLADMRPEWREPTFYVKDPVRDKRMDFTYLSAGGFAYWEKVNESDLGEIIEKCGEVLPAKVESKPNPDEKLYVFNCTACYNCFDRENGKARWTPDGRMAIQVEKYAFHLDRIGDANLFKIPETHRVAIYTITGQEEPEDEFYSLYHALGFTGLKFEEVWTDEVG